MTLTLEEVRSRIVDIAKMSGDDEAAHAAEDALHRDVLRYVVEKTPAYSSIHQIAEAALSTGELEFARWCA